MQAITENKTEDDLETVQETLNDYDLEELTAKQRRDENPLILSEIFKDFDPDEYPDSYRTNSLAEEKVFAYVENFRKQYAHLYRDRKPLFLCPKNEFGIEKFVCTTIKPTAVSINEFLDWDLASKFVSDYIVYRPLDPSYELPTYMFTPATVLRHQRGHCFEYSTLLCSLLLGVGYDAYVVNGYASREVCLYDETRDICPKMIPKIEETVVPAAPVPTKYIVKPPKDLTSKFDQKQEEKRLKKIADELAKQKADIDEMIRIKELPPEDPFFGLRIHSWVLVRCGQREIAESFFIEPLSGLARSLDSPNYFGIESVWNDRNYWVCMQDCSEGVAGLSYDLNNCAFWEFIFPSNDLPKTHLTTELNETAKITDMDEEEEEEEIEKHMDLPLSWVVPVCVTQAQYENRFPNGRKTSLYKKARLDQYGAYQQPDGLLERLSIFSDYERKTLVKVIEDYANRKDKLYHRTLDYESQWIYEYFAPGETRKLKEHIYKSLSALPNNDRTTVYYWRARFDGLERRVENYDEMIEYYQGRSDYLSYKFVKYSDQKKKFAPSANMPRPIEKMVLKYNRDPQKSAIDDIYELIFDNEDKKITVINHREDDRISSDIREFIKPNDEEIKGVLILWNQDSNYSYYLSDPNRKDKKRPELYKMMVDLIKAEDVAETRTRESEHEIQDILMDRVKEETYAQDNLDASKIQNNLEVKIYDTKRNDKAVRHRITLEKMAEEERLAKQEKVLDPFAPYLARLGFPAEITEQQALQMREDCLNDFKIRLVNKANYMQTRLEAEISEVKRRQGWFQQNQAQLSKDDELQYSKFLNEAGLRINILKQRIAKHKEHSHEKYIALEDKIKVDPRIASFLKTEKI